MPMCWGRCAGGDEVKMRVKIKVEVNVEVKVKIELVEAVMDIGPGELLTLVDGRRSLFGFGDGVGGGAMRPGPGQVRGLKAME